MNNRSKAKRGALVITRHRPDQVPGGAALRNMQNIRGLGELGRVDVLSVGEGCAGTAPSLSGVGEWHVVGAGRRRGWAGRCGVERWWWDPRVHPLLDHYANPVALRWLDRRLGEKRYRLVVIEELALGRYAGVCRRHGCKVVFDAHNVEGALRGELAEAEAGPRRTLAGEFKRRLLARRLRREEQRVVRQADVVWACSAQDAAQIRLLYGKEAAVVANGVDVASYRRVKPMAGAGNAGSPLRLLFTGSFNYYPNEEAAMRLIGEVMPAVWERRPEAELLLVGRGPTAAMQAAAVGDEKVRITGAVANVLPFLHDEAVMVVPLTLGGGTRLKILEAFAAGVPVVSSAKGAEGIDAVNGQHLLVRESAAAMAEAVVAVWEDAALRQRLVANAVDLVERRYSWPVAAKRIAASLGEVPRPVKGQRLG